MSKSMSKSNAGNKAPVTQVKVRKTGKKSKTARHTPSDAGQALRTARNKRVNAERAVRQKLAAVAKHQRRLAKGKPMRGAARRAARWGKPRQPPLGINVVNE